MITLQKFSTVSEAETAAEHVGIAATQHNITPMVVAECLYQHNTPHAS